MKLAWPDVRSADHVKQENKQEVETLLNVRTPIWSDSNKTHLKCVFSSLQSEKDVLSAFFADGVIGSPPLNESRLDCVYTSANTPVSIMGKSARYNMR